MLIPLLLIGCLAVVLFYALQTVEKTINVKKYNQSYVEIESEHYIPIPFEKIFSSIIPLWEAKSHSAEDLARLSRKIETNYFLEYNKRENSLLDHYSKFSPASDELSKQVDYKAEQAFLDDWKTMLEKANFKQLSQKKLDFALQEDYMCTLPVNIDWSKFDDKALSRYAMEHAESSADLPDFTNKLWIFHRGTGVDRTTNFLVMEKIDVLIVRFLHKIQHHKRAFSHRFFGGAAPEPEVAAPPEDPPTSSKIIKRITLQNSINFQKDGFSVLTKKTSLQEPTFKELIILYRLKPSQPGESTPINIMSYHNLPMADLEVTIPNSSGSLRPLDIIIFTITACIGILSALFKYYDTEGSSSVGSFALFSFVGLLFKNGYDYYNLMYYYRSIIVDILFSRFKDANDGVIVSTCHSVRRQELKEVFLAYVFLLLVGESTEKELDDEVEKFLNQMNPSDHNHIDFEADDALKKLLELGVATQKGDKYTAVSVEKALSQIDASA